LLEDLLVQLGLCVDDELALRGEPVLPELASPLAVAECAIAAVAASLLAAAELAELRTGRRPEVALDTAHQPFVAPGRWFARPFDLAY
jgi:hypothetical protein